jgi:hypothetical protein
MSHAAGKEACGIPYKFFVQHSKQDATLFIYSMDGCCMAV